MRLNVIRIAVSACVLALAMGDWLFWPVPAAAQTASDVIEKWGLLGTWAADCNLPPSRQNGYLAYVRRGGVVAHERDFGDARDSNEIVAATITADGSVDVTINFVNFSEIRTMTVIKGADGRYRVTSNRDSKGVYSVKNGILLGSGNPTKWVNRCR